jgi:hypothetical protein
MAAAALGMGGVRAGQLLRLLTVQQQQLLELRWQQQQQRQLSSSCPSMQCALGCAGGAAVGVEQFDAAVTVS